MIKRLYGVARANLSNFKRRKKIPEDSNFDFQDREFPQNPPPGDSGNYVPDPLAGYYANLELQAGASREEVKRAWRQLLKKYHPDLHSADPEKRKIATELTGQLNEAYRILTQELSKKG